MGKGWIEERDKKKPAKNVGREAGRYARKESSPGAKN